MTDKRTPNFKTAAKRRPRAGAAEKRTKTTGAVRDEPYHHGALHKALLAAAEAVLERDGLQGLTLRAVAREAGVSHAAPTHHFDDLTGLLSELAAVGFRRFNEAMREAGAVEAAPLQRALNRARAYLAYARAMPGMYGLMFRTERIDMTRPALHEASQASFAGLSGVMAATRDEAIPGNALTIDQAANIARAWSLTHGYATLLLDGRLTDILRRLPEGTTAETLFEAMLKATMSPPSI